jgi:hypothetical protein
MKTSRIVRIAAVSAMGAVGVLVPLGVAGAAPYPNGGTPPEVLPSDQTRPGSGSSTAAGAEVSPAVAAKSATRPSTLPFTGTDVAELVAIGGASVGVGVVLVRRSRRVRTS